MNVFSRFLTVCLFSFIITSVSAQTEAIVGDDLVFEESNGIVAVEAEHFYKQTATDLRQWYLYSKGVWPKAGQDLDDPHCFNASNNAYLELLPDTRVHHGHELIDGENFSGKPGKLGVLHYKINFNTPGRYYVWARAYSVGPEDNSLHVGINGTWPESGQRMQWCEGKKSWWWESKQRTEDSHCGVPYQIYIDIPKKGIHEITFSMREDGFEFDKFLMTTDRDYVPTGPGPEVRVFQGSLPDPFPHVERDMGLKRYMIDAIDEDVLTIELLRATSFASNGFYREKDRLAINPEKQKEASAIITYKASYWHQPVMDMVFLAIGENDGESEYKVEINGKLIGSYKAPLSQDMFEEGSKYCKVWKNLQPKRGDIIKVTARVGTDGQEFSRGRWAGIVFVEAGNSDKVLKAIDDNAVREGPVVDEQIEVATEAKLTGELKTWHKVTLTFDGPECSETDEVNPFMDYRLDVTFRHSETGKEYLIPGYFAADGNAGNTSATKGNKWRVHFAPDETGEWIYRVNFRKGRFSAASEKELTGQSGGYMDQSIGMFSIEASDKTGRDFRGKGMLQYVGERYLKFAGTGEYFLKVGPDAPENMLSYEEFDGTFHNDGYGDNLVKSWEAHEQHWNEGDPTWKDGKGKDIIGAVNYLASKGVNAFSFLTNNIKGDDKNVFPYIDYHTYDRIDCSKMDQWEVVFSHADSLGMFLHFKLAESENQGLLDNGGLGANSSLYYREMMARFGHHLALNWNLCEESGDWMVPNITPPHFTRQRLQLAGYFADRDPYKHHVVIHNGNPFDDMLGPESGLTGPSVQAFRPDFSDVHGAVLKWINASAKAGKQWAVACDESGHVSKGVLPDSEDAEHNNARMDGLWGAFLAGGWGTEWYFGYDYPHSDLSCEDYASRDKFWEQGKIALDFFSENQIPFWEMESHNDLVFNEGDYCFAKPGEIYVFYLKQGSSEVDLSSAIGKLSVMWYNPRTGGELQKGKIKSVDAGSNISLGNPPKKDGKDWVAVVQRIN